MSKKTAGKRLSRGAVLVPSNANKPDERVATNKPGLVDGSSSAANAERVSIDSAGRIVVPAKIRKKLGIKGGQELSISLVDDVIKLQTVQTAVQSIQKLARRKRTTEGSVVDEFVAQRRKEAAKE